MIRILQAFIVLCPCNPLRFFVPVLSTLPSAHPRSTVKGNKPVSRFARDVLAKFGWDHDAEVRALQFVHGCLSSSAPTPRAAPRALPRQHLIDNCNPCSRMRKVTSPGLNQNKHVHCRNLKNTRDCHLAVCDQRHASNWEVAALAAATSRRRPRGRSRAIARSRIGCPMCAAGVAMTIDLISSSTSSARAPFVHRCFISHL